MTIITKISKTPDKEWNLRLENNRFSTIHNTTQYIEYVKIARNQPSYYVSFENKGEVIAQMGLHRISRAQKKIAYKLKKIPFSSKLSSIVKNIAPIFIWDYGPVVFREDLLKEIFNEITKLPSEFKTSIKGTLHPFHNSSEILMKNGWQEKKMGTFLIDLRISEEELWTNIDRRSGRKAVNKALKNGVKISTIKNLDDLKIHHQLLNEGKQMAGLQNYPFKSLKYSWNILKEIGQTGFIAWLDDVPLASTLVTTYNGYLNEWGFAEAKIDRKNLTFGSDLIKWHLIKWGHKNNFSYFDLSGVEFSPETSKEKGIFNFKKKWGGNLMEWYHYTFMKN